MVFKPHSWPLHQRRAPKRAIRRGNSNAGKNPRFRIAVRIRNHRKYMIERSRIMSARIRAPRSNGSAVSVMRQLRVFEMRREQRIQSDAAEIFHKLPLQHTERDRIAPPAVYIDVGGPTRTVKQF